MVPSPRLLGVLLQLFFLLGFPLPNAQAEGDLKYERANVLFREGRKLMADGRHREACERFEQSLTLEQAIGTKFNLAACWETLGKTASAQALFGEVATLAETEGQEARARVARERVAALEPRLSKLQIDADRASPGLRIERNDQLIEPENWGMPVAVDPGAYEIRASAPGKMPWVKRVSVAAMQSLVSVSVPRLESGLHEDENQCGPGDTKQLRPRPSKRRAPSRDVPLERKKHGIWRTASVGLAALGVGGITAGTVFALKYRSNDNRARGICKEGFNCTEAEIDRHSTLTRDARASRTGAAIGFGVGGAALIGAAVAYFTAPLEPRTGGTAVRAHASCRLDGFCGLAAEGRF